MPQPTTRLVLFRAVTGEFALATKSKSGAICKVAAATPDFREARWFKALDWGHFSLPEGWAWYPMAAAPFLSRAFRRSGPLDPAYRHNCEEYADSCQEYLRRLRHAVRVL
ncbi:hypothetical protein [Thiomonas sp.]